MDDRGRSAAEQTIDALLAKLRQRSNREHRLAVLLQTEAAAQATRPLPPSLPSVPELLPLLPEVMYRQGDTVGHAAACIMLWPLMAMVALSAWVVARREAHAIWLLCGASLNAFVTCTAQQSHHLSVTAFLVAHGLLFLWRDAGMADALIWKPVLSVACLSFLALVATSIMYLRKPAGAEMLSGILLGATTGTASYAGYHAMLPCLRHIIDSSFCRYFYVHDASRIHDVLRTDYESHIAVEHTKRAA